MLLGAGSGVAETNRGCRCPCTAELPDHSANADLSNNIHHFGTAHAFGGTCLGLGSCRCLWRGVRFRNRFLGFIPGCLTGGEAQHVRCATKSTPRRNTTACSASLAAGAAVVGVPVLLSSRRAGQRECATIGDRSVTFGAPRPDSRPPSARLRPCRWPTSCTASTTAQPRAGRASHRSRAWPRSPAWPTAGASDRLYVDLDGVGFDAPLPK